MKIAVETQTTYQAISEMKHGTLFSHNGEVWMRVKRVCTMNTDFNAVLLGGSSQKDFDTAGKYAVASSVTVKF